MEILLVLCIYINGADYLYENAYDFNDGLAAVRSKTTDKYGYIDTSGNTVIDFEYDLWKRKLVSGWKKSVRLKVDICLNYLDF